MKAVHLSFTVWLLAVAVNAGTRVALVSTCGGEAGADVLALAEAKLSQEPGIELVERREVERVLQEQKLWTCGLTSFQQAIAAGKLLRVEVFAALETFPDAKSALGLVAFDARTGVRLADTTLGAGAATQMANEVVAAVLQAKTKAEARVQAARTVCLLSVRNADLPRALDSFCETVGRLIERQLLHSPDLTVLERARLEAVNRERQISPAANSSNLRASVIMMELEFARVERESGVRVRVYLTGPGGQKIPCADVKHSPRDVGQLTAKLMRELALALRATPPTLTLDRSREAERFHQESRFHRAHAEYLPALQALESAVALDPDRLALQTYQCTALLETAVRLIETQNSYQMPPPLGSNAVSQSLGLANRGAQMLLELHPKFPVSHCQEPGMVYVGSANSDLGTAFAYLRGFIGQLTQLHKDGKYASQFDSRALAQFAEVQEKRKQYGLFTPESIRRESDAAVPALDLLDTQRQAIHVAVQKKDRAAIARTVHEFAQTAARVAETWGLSGVNGNRYFDGVLAAFKQLEQYPAIRFAEWRALAKVFRRTGRGQWLCFKTMAELEYRAPTDVPGFLEMLDDYDAIARDPKCTPGVLGEQLVIVDEGLRYKTRRLDPNLGFKFSTPWESAVCLVDCLGSTTEITGVFAPRVQGERVFALTQRKDGANLALELVAWPVTGGAMQRLGRYVSPSRSAVEPTGANFVGDKFVVSTIRDGILIFHRDNGRVEQIGMTEGLPTNRVDAAVCLGNTVYAGVSDGYLISCDLGSKKLEMLASSRRREVRSPFDNQAPFSLRFLVADPERQRLLGLVAHDEGSPVCLWSYHVGTKAWTKIHQVANFDYYRGWQLWVSEVVDDQLYFRTYGIGSHRLNLRTDVVEQFDSFKPAKAPDHPPAAPFSLLPAIYPAFCIRQNWLWCGGPWGRFEAGGNRQEFFPSLRSNHKESLSDFFSPSEVLRPLGQNRMLVGDRKGLWILQLNSKEKP